MTRYLAWIAATLIVAGHVAAARAQAVVAPVVSPVVHPHVAVYSPRGPDSHVRPATTPNQYNYRENYLKANPNLPMSWEVHHRVPQKYASIAKNWGINIHDNSNLRGVSRDVHGQITNEWNRWQRDLERQPTGKELTGFAKRMDAKYQNSFHNESQLARMRNLLNQRPATRAFDQVSRTRIALLVEKQALRGTGRVLTRSAGPVGLAVVVAMDANEIYGHFHDYQLGKLSQQQLIIALARSGGGIAGAWAGAAGGAWVGAQIGLLGGPWAWVTVPVGGFIGGAVGGVAGYYGGSYVGEFTAQAWYGSLDKNVRERVSGWITDTANPVGN